MIIILIEGLSKLSTNNENLIQNYYFQVNQTTTTTKRPKYIEMVFF